MRSPEINWVELRNTGWESLPCRNVSFSNPVLVKWRIKTIAAKKSEVRDGIYSPNNKMIQERKLRQFLTLSNKKFLVYSKRVVSVYRCISFEVMLPCN